MICLICTSKPTGHRSEGMSVNIREITSACGTTNAYHSESVLGQLLFKVTSYILLATELFSYSYILPIK